MTPDPYARNTPPNAPLPAPPRRKVWQVIVPIVVVGLVVLGVRLAINAANYSHSVDSIISSMEPTPSVYNTKLKKVVDADKLVLVGANRVLGDARYLGVTKDYLNFDNAVSDAQLSLDLAGTDQLSTLSKEDYVTTLADIDESFSELKAAQAAVEADMVATPSPAPGAATPSPTLNP